MVPNPFGSQELNVASSHEQFNQRVTSPSQTVPFKEFLKARGSESVSHEKKQNKNSTVHLFQGSLTVNSHLSIAVFLQQELNVRAGWRDVLRTGSDSCAQPVPLVKQKRKTAHRRPECGGGKNQQGVRRHCYSQAGKTTTKIQLLWLVFFLMHAVTLVVVSCCWLRDRNWSDCSYSTGKMYPNDVPLNGWNMSR